MKALKSKRKINRTATLCIALSSLYACASIEKQQANEVVLSGEAGKPIHMQELSGESEIVKKELQKKRRPIKKKRANNEVTTITNKANARGIKGISANSRKQCLALIERIATPYKELYTKLDKSTYTPDNSLLDQLVHITPAACDSSATFKEVAALLSAATGAHSGRVGIMLALTGKNNHLATFMIKGMRAAFAESGKNFEQAAILKDTTTRHPEAVLAELIFKDKVSAVIGGFENIDAQVLAHWSDRLMLPVVITNHDRNVGSRSRYAYMVYPDEMRLAYTLAAEAEKRNIKRIAILKPSSRKSDRLVEYFKQAFSARGGQVVHDLLYTPANFDSMQAVSRTIFRIDAGERQDEYREAYQRAKQLAQAQGAPFDPRMVVLKPLINFDAVFLPDDFRTARHFAKLFKFHQVDKMTMIGNHEWRSPALIEPYDEFLEGSFFGDFIGSYSQLPPAISAPTTGSPYFVLPQSVLSVDFQLIGYRVGHIGSTIAGNSQESRRRLPKIISTMTSNSSAFFGNGPVFTNDHQSNWPTYVFSVASGSLKMEGEHTKIVIPSAQGAVANQAQKNAPAIMQSARVDFGY